MDSMGERKDIKRDDGGTDDRVSGRSAAPGKSRARPTGRVVHDERGNAVWDFLKETSRIAIGSTSRLLKRLEVPELSMEDDRPARSVDPKGRDAGGGWDPYGQPTEPRRPLKKG
jgi:hypothetical protein